MPEGENIECICISNEWCAVFTSSLYLRVYNLVGIELYCICMEKTIVALTAYENFCLYVYHDAAPIFGC